MQGTYVALRPLQYGPRFPEDMVDFHQVFEMRDEQNDEPLARLKFVAQVGRGQRLSTCGQCGKKFTDEFALNRHGKLRHEAKREPVVVDDNLPAIDTNNPAALEERAALLRAQMRNTISADGYSAPNPDAEAEAAQAADDKMIQEAAPIPWDKTLAAMKANDVKVPEVRTSSKRRRVTKRRKG